MHAGIIIQVRVGSTRLPNKALLPFNGDDSILALMIDRLVANTHQVPVVVATTREEEDETVVDLCGDLDVPFYRGSTLDVLDRFDGAADRFGFDWIIRICADNPFLNLEAVDRLIEEAGTDGLDYLSFEAAPGLPAIRSHLGLYAELVSLIALRRAAEMIQDPKDKEHVTKFIYENPDKFQLKFLPAHEEVFGRADLRFTVDDETDFGLMQQLYKAVGEEGATSIEHLVSYVDSHPGYLETMKQQIKRYTK